MASTIRDARFGRDSIPAMKFRLLLWVVVATTLWLIPASSSGGNIDTRGFFDLEAEVSDKDAAGKIWTFDQHHLNIISNASLDNRFRLCWEIEWEHASMVSSSSITGNIYIARSYLEFKHSDAFLIWVGKFLAPFGIYNERHDATPTFLSTFLPQSIYGRQEFSYGGQDRLFAKHGTGVQVRGSLASGQWETEYRGYVINGRGNKPDESDQNPNKGVGFRLATKIPSVDLHLGTSFYSDRNGTAHDSRQSSLGFDAEIDISDFHAESELLHAKVEGVDSTFAPNDIFEHKQGFYLLGAYTCVERLTPFVRYEIFDPNTDKKTDRSSVIISGLNFSLTTSVYLKSEIQFHHSETVGSNNYRIYVSSIAVAF